MLFLHAFVLLGNLCLFHKRKCCTRIQKKKSAKCEFECEKERELCRFNCVFQLPVFIHCVCCFFSLAFLSCWRLYGGALDGWVRFVFKLRKLKIFYFRSMHNWFSVWMIDIPLKRRGMENSFRVPLTWVLVNCRALTWYTTHTHILHRHRNGDEKKNPLALSIGCCHPLSHYFVDSSKQSNGAHELDRGQHNPHKSGGRFYTNIRLSSHSFCKVNIARTSLR